MNEAEKRPMWTRAIGPRRSAILSTTGSLANFFASLFRPSSTRQPRTNKCPASRRTIGSYSYTCIAERRDFVCQNSRYCHEKLPQVLPPTLSKRAPIISAFRPLATCTFIHHESGAIHSCQQSQKCCRHGKRY